jgi:glutathione S-transferase
MKGTRASRARARYCRAVLRLYHREKAGRPARVRWVLEEIGVPYEYVVMTAEEAAAGPHLARHPLGRVPVIETDDGTLFESTAICLQLADTHPEANLIPPLGSFERGEVYTWSIFAMTELEAYALRVWRAKRDGAPDAELEQQLADRFAAVEDRLREREFVVGDRFTVADIVLGAVLLICRRVEELPPSETIDSYLARLEQRPAKQRAYA